MNASSGLTVKADIDFDDTHEDLNNYDVLRIPSGSGIDEVLRKECEPVQLIKAFAVLQQQDPSKQRMLMSIGTICLAWLPLRTQITTSRWEIICQDAARRGDLEQTDITEENYVVNNARFDLGKKMDETSFILTKRPDGRRKSIARKSSNAWKESVKRRESHAPRAVLRLGELRVITNGGVISGFDASRRHGSRTNTSSRS